MRKPKASELVHIYVQAANSKELNPLGSAMGWPAAIYDCWSILKQQEAIDEYAQKKAVNKAFR